jgi:hypothetical protein
MTPTIKVRAGNAPIKKQSDRPAQPKRWKGLIQKIMEIVSNDIKRLFGKDDKSMDNKMRYDEFMERFGK